EVRNGAVIVALLVPSPAAIVVGAGRFWIEPDRLGVIRDGAVVVALGGPSDATAGVGRGRIRVEPDRLIARLDGHVWPICFGVPDPEFAVKEREITANISARCNRALARQDRLAAGRLKAGVEVVRRRWLRRQQHYDRRARKDAPPIYAHASRP